MEKPTQLRKKIARSPDQLGFLVRDERKARGLTQAQLAEEAGLVQKTVSEFERAPKNARLETVFLLLRALGLEFSLDATQSPQGEIE
jgi:HTH-type transcriptional regulator/antitoxin HipB